MVMFCATIGGIDGTRSFAVVAKESTARVVTVAVFRCGVWLARSGARWPDLLEDRFGPYQTVKGWYHRWIEQSVFDQILKAIATDPDLEWLSIDATVIRVQAQAAGGQRKRGDASPGSRLLSQWIWQ